MLTNCKISTAKSAGFCFGVDRAVKIVYNSLNTHNKVVTLGPIIHNPDVVADLESKGVHAIESCYDLTGDETVIIRSHGVGQSTYDKLIDMGINYIDATCPFVSRIHKIASEKSAEGYTILIAGDKNHPEVIGIKGHCNSDVFIFKDDEELRELLTKLSNNFEKKVAIIAQTTYNIKMWDKCKNLIKKHLPNAIIYDTICNATTVRQAEAVELAKESDIMIIVGGKQSSNTVKLKNICEKYCKCYHIENAEELKNIDFSGANLIGISAGASTPAYIIKEVQTIMSEILKNQDEDFNFEEALEQSFKKIYIGDKVKGYITSVNANEIIVDIGTKHTGYVPISEISEDPTVKATDIVKVGDEIDLIVLKINDQDGIVTLSKKKVDAMVGFDKVLKAKEDGTVLNGNIINVVKGGVIAATNGVKVFIPASQTGVGRDEKLDTLLKKNVDFKIIEVNPQKGRAVGSIKAVIKEKKDELQNKFFETIEVGGTYTGEVKSITDYGVFVDLGGVDGLIRKPDLTWQKIKHPSEIVSIGDKLEVTIKDVDKESKKVSLIFKKASENPWEVFKDKFSVDSVVSAKIVSVTPFGAFAEIIPGIDGLIHISQIANQRVEKVSDLLSVGQTVEAKITEIDLEKKRISLSMRALIEETNEEEAATVEETVSE